MSNKPPRERADSLNKTSDLMLASETIVPVPEGVEIHGGEEMLLWKQFTGARLAEDWRDFDLLLMAKIVKLETEIRKNQSILDKTGVIISNKRGNPTENPLLRVIDMLQRRQLTLIRSMSLTQTYADPRVLNEAGRERANAGGTLEKIKGGGVMSLLASPN